MTYILLSLAAVNIFMAGYCSRDTKPNIKWPVAWLFFGCGILVALLLIAISGWVLDKMDKYLQIKFWWGYYFSDKYDSPEKRIVDKYNEWAKDFQGRSLRHIMWRRALRALNENYNNTLKTDK